MTRFRTHLMALLGGATLIALSVSGALGAAPWGDPESPNRGQSVSAFVHTLVFGGDEDVAEEEEEPADEPEATDEETDEDGEDAEANAHGKCVSEVAHSDELGGPNANHGGAVSEAARVTCWETGDETTEEGTDEAVDEAVDETAATRDRAHGRSGDHRGAHGSHAAARAGDRG